MTQIIYFGLVRAQLVGVPQRIPSKQLIELLVEGEVNYLGLDFEFWRGPGRGLIRAYAIKSDGNVHLADYNPRTGNIIPSNPHDREVI